VTHSPTLILSRRSVARAATAVASTGGLLVGLGVVMAAPANAATAADCTVANTVSSGDSADIQTLLDDVSLPVICLDGTFQLDSTLTLSRDVTVFGRTSAVLDGMDSVRIFTNGFEAAQLTVQNLTLQNGFAVGDGGAIRAASVTAIDSVFIDNSVTYLGGAISVQSGATITRSAFEGNSANVDGAAIHGYGTVSVSESTFVDNSASGNGGAIFTYGSAIIAASTFVSNAAQYFGGAVSANSSSVTNSTFFGHSAGDEGGALFAGGSVVQFSTFLDNTAPAPVPAGELPGDAIYLEVNGDDTLVIRGNVFAGSTGNPQLGVGVIIGPASIIDWGGNVFSTEATTESDLDVPAASTQFGKTAAHVFGTGAVLGDNGGATPTLALVAGSPAIDAVPQFFADASLAPAAVSDVVVDQRGASREGLLDAGSFEFVASDAELAATGIDSNMAVWWAAFAALLLGSGVAVAIDARRRARR
jgi:predicted outer membrane repeat protein